MKTFFLILTFICIDQITAMPKHTKPAVQKPRANASRNQQINAVCAMSRDLDKKCGSSQSDACKGNRTIVQYCNSKKK